MTTRRNTTSRGSSSPPKAAPRGRRDSVRAGADAVRQTPVALPLGTGVLIQRIAAGTGDGVGKQPSGLTTFCDQGWPGDTVRGTIIESQKRWARITVTSVEPGIERQGGACEHAGVCGGCRFQGAPYELEMRWKVDAALDGIRRLSPSLVWPSPKRIAADSIDGWRERVRWKLDPNGYPAFTRPRSHDPVTIHRCQVLHPALQKVLAQLRRHAPFTGRGWIFAEHSDGQVAILAGGPAFESAENQDKLARLASETCAVWIAPKSHASQDNDDADFAPEPERGPRHLGGPAQFARSVAGTSIPLPVGLFSQAHATQNARLRELVLQGVGDSAARVLELFAGFGNFSIPLANAGHSVLAVEGSGPAVRAGQAATSEIANLSWLVADLSEGLPGDAANAWARYDAVIVDPPRTGLPPAMATALCSPGPRTLIYVSCDPPTLGRDSERLTAGGWAVESLHLVDMFPRTHHLESVVVFRR